MSYWRVYYSNNIASFVWNTYFNIILRNNIVLVIYIVMFVKLLLSCHLHYCSQNHILIIVCLIQFILQEMRLHMLLYYFKNVMHFYWISFNTKTLKTKIIINKSSISNLQVHNVVSNVQPSFRAKVDCHQFHCFRTTYDVNYGRCMIKAEHVSHYIVSS